MIQRRILLAAAASLLVARGSFAQDNTPQAEDAFIAHLNQIQCDAAVMAKSLADAEKPFDPGMSLNLTEDRKQQIEDEKLKTYRKLTEENYNNFGNAFNILVERLKLDLKSTCSFSDKIYIEDVDTINKRYRELRDSYSRAGIDDFAAQTGYFNIISKGIEEAADLISIVEVLNYITGRFACGNDVQIKQLMSLHIDSFSSLPYANSVGNCLI